MKNKFVRAAAFLGILLVLLVLLSVLMQPKDNTEADGIHNEMPHGILGEPENTLDLVIVGDSTALCAISPLNLWNETGIAAHVCARGDNKMFYTYEFAEAALEHQQPKMLMLEADALYTGVGRTEILRNKFERLLSIFRYHDRWKDLHLRDLNPRVEYTHTSDTKGYSYRDEIEYGFWPGYMSDWGEHAGIQKENKQYARDILQLCREHGVQMVLLSVPSSINWNYARHQGAAAFAEELGIPYIDMNLPEDLVGIDWTVDTMDAGNHLNYTGAAKATHWLAAWLQNTNLFPDHRTDPKYDSWNQAWEDFQNNYLS